MNDTTRAFVNCRSGELATLSLDDVELAEDDVVDPAELPEWQAKALPRMREVVRSADWLLLPSSFEIHEWEIMKRFARTVRDSEVAERLDRALHGRGAFRMFRDAVHRLGIEPDWQRFRRSTLREIARRHLDRFGVPYVPE
ncbi:MAG TPA: hypothetical protein VE974_29890 [Thermoanaerobaculia bacterium]|nr:hypothetical protein [Thermoanaerobaculia bacterium]